MEQKRILEALLFASTEPLTLKKLKNVIDLPTKEIKELLTEMQQEYDQEDRAFGLEEIAEGYLLRTRRKYGPYLTELHHHKRADKLSKATLETLAIIAYRQPITKPAMEQLRGVDCSGPVAALQDRGLVEAVGKLEAPGRPTLYGTTSRFLQYFGLKSLKELQA